ncbi:MAG: site-specific DNA-methyltransferase [Candidatus Lokiarchaeota archaeon]|nr:site-specific DNA-methyltransferase [Candidatus Lokiarchaeota archaeon]
MAKDDVKKIELIWPGKHDDRVSQTDARKRNYNLRVIERVDESQATREAKRAPRQRTLHDYEDGKKRVPTTVWVNKLIQGENKAVMGSLLANLEGKVDLAYIDPPFATGTDFSFTTAIGDGEEAIEAPKRSAPIEARAYNDSWGKGLGSYLQMMHERLALIHRLLSEKGMLYLHCDWRVVHYLKVMLDSIFGHSGDEREEAGFKSEIIWFHQVIGMPRTNAFYFPKQHETILAYSKSRKDRIAFNAGDKLVRKEFSESIKKAVKTDDQGNAYYKRGRTGTKNEWAYDPKYLQTRVNLENGVLVADVWDEWKSYQPRKGERTGYPTQKPEQILERIIAASTNPGDLVGDFFCGSGTTLTVAERLGRRWIGCDFGHLAIHAAHKRLMDISDCKPYELLGLGNQDVSAGSRAQNAAGSMAAGRTLVDVRVSTVGKRARVELAGYEILDHGLVPPEVLGAVKGWADYVDYWAVDFDSRGDTFVNRWCSYRTMQDRKLELESEEFEYASGGTYKILVRVVDVLGTTSIAGRTIEAKAF